MKENYQKAFSLREKREEIVQKFRKEYESATQETQDELEKVCKEIESLMDEDCFCVEFHSFDQAREPKRIIKNGRIIPSEKEEYNKFFAFAIQFRNKFDEFTPVIHVHDHYPYRVHKIEHSLDFLQGAYKNQFVDDFVYETVEGEMAIRLGNLKMNAWNTLYDEVFTTLDARPTFFGSYGATILTRGRKEVWWYEGEAWYHSNRKLGEI